MSIPLPVRKNIRDSEPKLQENLQKINESTGKEWTVEANWEESLSKVDASQKERIGVIYYNEAMSALAANIVSLCKKATVKEAFNEATSSNKVVIKVDEKQRDYWSIALNNGDLILSHKPSIANISAIQYFDMINVIPTPGIPLFAKLSLEETQPNLEEDLKMIADATGVSDWVFEADFNTIVPQLDVNTQKNIGKIYYSEMLAAFARNLKKSLQNEILKEAFVEAVSEKKIEIQLNDKQKDYNDINFKNGTVIISHKKSICNISQIEYFDLAPKIPVPGLPLVPKINIAKLENQESLKNALAKIVAATGVEDWAVEVDFLVTLPLLDKGQQDRIGDTYYKEAIPNFASDLEKKLKNDTIKEAFNEATSQRKILIQVNDKIKSYWNVKFENGAVVIEHKKSIANLSELSYYPIETVIPVPGLSLVIKLNIIEHRPRVEESLEMLAKATGAEWTFEVDYDAIVPQLDEGQRKTIGNIYADVLRNFVNNVQKRCQNPLIKEALIEATSERKIVMRVVEKQNKYWDILFQNNTVTLSHKKSIVNLSEVEYFPIESVIPVPGVLSLEAKINIEKSRAAMQASLEKIAKATGHEYTFDEACLQTFYPKLDENQKKNIGNTFLGDVLANFANNVTKRLKDDMVKEAYNEVATSHQITVVQNPAQSKYWEISFKDGNVVLSFKSIANLSEIEYYDIEKLL